MKRLPNHGMNKTRFYRTWTAMIQRCRNKNDSKFKYYGGRGINFCSRWNDFRKFYEDMFDGYNDNLTLDRINTDGDYNKKNCRWASYAQQNRNTSRNVIYRGEYAIDASIRLGGTKHLISSRIYRGWSIEKAFTTPYKKRS